MTTPTSPPAGTSAVRRAVAYGWANRPSLGAWAFLLGVPGSTQVVFGQPWWLAAAVQWPLYALLWLVITVIDVRRSGHELPADLAETGKGARP
ncbi:hypothetical protein [Actinomadura macrotermitis]|uniref:Uncharacterized protein n=1 Tax=Actinomadura macrotermitis TaxID=2585200 RepID=A0A7K0C1A8_9ACTN|nr:hypothetical protein [Actinomadura macrotermitis]MQY07253.1 hypothetical protein [Actinomadura macrotermitis]